ncbi:MAG: radical SAM protein [Pseudomonadota bacterium]
MRVALVNTNRIKPPIAPIGLEYVAEALNEAGHHVQVLDLCWADDWDSAIEGFLGITSFELVGITLRNTDDCTFTNRQSFIDEFADMVRTIRRHTDALIVVGGVGFSVMPEEIVKLCDVHAGVWGDGEFALVQLANRIEEKRDWLDLPNLIWCRDGRWYRNPSSAPPLTNLPPMSRSWVDNCRYFREGGQAGIETKRGCSCRCIYCADPVAKGKEMRIRPPEAVVDELERLLQQGIDHIHTCDSEFNLPEVHAFQVCKEIIRRNLSDRLRWYAYCSPVQFSLDLAELMRRAGCVGINFGVDNGDEEMLKRLRRDFTPEDILSAAHSCKTVGIAVMFDLLLGSPGETKESLTRTIELMRKAAPERVGVAVGVRVYPGTELATLVIQDQLKEGLVGGHAHSAPLFFIEPRIAPFAFELLDELTDGDSRFFFFDPSRPDRNYNYNANQLLVEAIHEGYRGAYWDILRRYG